MTSRWINVEFHCHTVRSSDGMIPHDSMIRTAAAVGLDVIAITDHDTVEGALELRERVKEQGASLQVIVGEERTLADGSHLIGLFLQRGLQAKELGDVVQEIDGAGGLCLIPHPFRRKDGLLRNGLEPLRFLEGRVVGFELFSAKCSFAENARARELLAVPGLSPFGGSDAHYESDLGESMNVVEWHEDLRTSIQRMFEKSAPYQILGKPQANGDSERLYAPLYYRVKKRVRLPKVFLPVAKQCYRHYRNWRVGIGRKALREIHRHG
jgi:predicted metal-dependent phosphoesterase TrpH